MVRFILLDIEGTTTDVDFVHKVLFPYAATHMARFIQEHAANSEVQGCLQAVLETVRAEENRTLTDTQVVEQLLRWIQDDRKHTALKHLQGMIWKDGFEKGDYQGHVYPDVPATLESWKKQGIGLGIYSSGSVQAQKLLFKHSICGDLTPYFSHYFDTRLGEKKSADSYAQIADRLNLAPIDILFLSDVEEELDAAAQAGFQIMQLVRDNHPSDARAISSKYPTVRHFTDINLEEASAVC
jgi:enolase-phosphatase E1